MPLNIKLLVGILPNPYAERTVSPYGKSKTAQVRALVDGMAACPFKFNVGGLSSAAEGGYKQLPVRLVGIADIVNGGFQR